MKIMKDFKVGSEIQVGDRLFEVISYEYVNEDLSHVMLANGTVVEATYEGNDENADYSTVHINADGEGTSDELWLSNLSHYGIIPLVEIVSEPIEFFSETQALGTGAALLAPFGVPIGKKFRVIEVVD